MFIVTKFVSVATYLAGIPPRNLCKPSNMWSREVTRRIKYIISLLTGDPLATNLKKFWLNARSSHLWPLWGHKAAWKVFKFSKSLPRIVCNILSELLSRIIQMYIIWYRVYCCKNKDSDTTTYISGLNFAIISHTVLSTTL